MFNQNNCYILIIPGFGIISTAISASSNKSVFGQDGPFIGIIQLMQQTICREFKNCYNNSQLQNTNNVSNIIYSFIVIIFVIWNNPQITKARSEKLKSEIINLFGLSIHLNSNNFLNSFVYRHKKKSFNKQLRYTHTKNSVLYNNTNKLNPYFVTGFTDGEGCFLINMRPNPKLKMGYSV